MSKIQAEYTTWRELVHAIAEVEHAPPTIAEVTKQLEGVKTLLAKEKAKLADLQKRTEKEYKEWVQVRDRTSKRLWIKIKHPSSHGERLTAMESKEEKEYLAAFATEQEAKARIAALEDEAGTLQAQLDTLRPLATMSSQYKTQLANLYRRVFGGPTPEYPEEDAAEAAVADAERADYAAQTDLTNLQRCRALVEDTMNALDKAIYHMEEAKQFSNWDRFGGGTMTDMMERNEISQAQTFVDRARLYSSQAEQLCRGIPTLAYDNLQMPQGNLMSDMLFDNYFTDTAFHNKIKDGIERLRRAREGVRSNTLYPVGRRVDDAQRAKDRTAKTLLGAREALEKLRSDIMASQGGAVPIPANDVPPTYAA